MESQIRPKAPRCNPPSDGILNGAGMIMEVLAAEGGNTMFGCSGGAILRAYDSVDASEMF